MKSAWKVLSPRDSGGRFHTMDAYVYTEAGADSTGGRRAARSGAQGLVGFHIAHKTTTYPQWVWATFEQVAAWVPAGSGLHPTFSDPDCDCPTQENQIPARPWRPDQPGVPTQVVRVTPIDTGTARVNARWQETLGAAGASSPWQYYELVGVQRPRNTADTIGLGAPYPQFLANTLLETYDQGNMGRARSCLECHHRATTPGDSAVGGAKFSDYSYLFMLAQGDGG